MNLRDSIHLTKQGFTLLEVLMAIAIFALVMGLAYGSYNATFRIINGAGAQAEVYSKARTTMERIQEDLESFFPGEDMIFTGTSESTGEYRADTLRFTSTSQVILHPDQTPIGHTIIHYQVQTDPETNTLSLYRSELLALPGATDGEEDDEDLGLLLCDQLLEVAFDYRNRDGDDVEEWENGDEDTALTSLPEQITISLRFADGQEETTGTLFKTALTLPGVKKRP
ncbi:MAG: prepilin-type N-terminal cleavage/methylation domain-containing protein [Proteobacteria bacterium]|nr:prepilin-type N-terminal cleavage/methylation domain-containing protein [Pseudomonadota bacterium]MBU1058030.1 prepilin-type N-terminal cleavage/methylation domain-containing protein [Pseudomonadota bacterium]